MCESNFEYIIAEACNSVAKRYITAMLQKKVSFKTYEESLMAVEKVRKEVGEIRKCFSCISASLVESDCPLDIINTLSEVLKCEDAEMLSLDIHEIVDKYPDITEDHLMRLLYLRGDMPRAELREKVAFAMKISKPKTVNSQMSSIFKNLVFVDRIINW